MISLDFLDVPFLIESALMGISWYVGFLYIRKGFNPSNTGKLDQFKQEAIYGGIAAAMSPIVSRVITSIIVDIFGIRV